MRVDLVDPGSEGLALRAVLRAAGLDVTPRDLSTLLESGADVIVLAGDAPGALEALRRLRDDGPRPDVAVVLVGAPPGLEPRTEGPAFGAEWAIGRDAAPDRLARVVREVVARGRAAAASGLRAERTLDLGREESQVSRLRQNEDGARSAQRVSDVAPAPEPGSGEIALGAPISLELEAILRAGAERAFPAAHDVDVSLPVGEETARELVPDDFIAGAELFLDDDEPAADSLTFVGGPPPRAERTSRPPPSALSPASAKKTFAGGARERTPSTDAPRGEARVDREATRAVLSTGAGVPPRPQLGAAASEPPGPADRSALTGAEAPLAGEGSALALLRVLSVLDSPGPGRRLRIEAGALRVELGVGAGMVLGLSADVSRRVLVALGQRAAESEPEAEARLEALVLGGLVPRTRRARFEEQARRAILAEVFGARALRWCEIEGAPDAGRGRALSLPLVRELADAAARAIDAERAGELVGGTTVRLVPTARWERFATAAGVPLALDAALTDRGASIGRLAMALEDEPGLPGRLVALVALGALEPGAHEADVPEDLAARARARAAVEAARRLADDADYFSLLGLGPRAGALEIEDAFAAASARLSALDLDALGLGALIGDRDVALGALAEARRVLGHAAWRDAYAAALARG